MNLTLDMSVPALTVFLQGLLSFFSPCVLPLVPLYIGYLAGGTVKRNEEGQMIYPRKTVMLNTVFFVVGISFAFFLLGFGFTTLGKFFGNYGSWFARIGGIIMILFGLYQLGVFGQSRVVEQERRLPFRLDRLAMNPFTALLLGFTFSFAWTPCVGPALASVLLMASSAKSAASGYLLIGVYVIGFILPFLAVGLFTGSVLSFFKKHQRVIRYTVKISGVLLILMGVMTLTGWMNGITGYLSKLTDSQVQQEEVQQEEVQEDVADNEMESSDAASDATTDVENVTEKDTTAKDTTPDEETTEEERPVIPAPDFTLLDQYGVEHTLSDYKGQVVFLNFWATWCGPCQAEMPDIQALYEEWGLNEEELVILGVANPKTDERPTNSDVSEEEVAAFLEEGGYTYPVVMDLTGEVFYQYGIQAFPTTFMIDKAGNAYGYITGSLTREMMDSIIDQTFAGGQEYEQE